MKTITISFGPANTLTRRLNDDATVGSVLDDAGLQAALGFGRNVQALDENRRVLPRNCVLVHGAHITLETVANQKANDDTIRVTFSFGPANTMTREVPSGTTIGDILRDPAWKAGLGFGTNVKAMIDRQEQSAETVLAEGDKVELETVANQKAR